jgi:hypothetical protein
MTSLHKHAARGAAALALAFVFAFSASAAQKSRCDRILEKLGDRLVDATCVESPDLTTSNANTTPLNNSIPGLPPFAFTPQTDRSVIAPYVPNRTTTAVPGVQINARIASDPRGPARFPRRLPDHWNGDLVVAGASGTRSEFNGDFAWSDYVLQKGYAYASQNKGTLNLILFVNPATDNLACRLNPSSPFFAHFYDNDPGQEFTRWAEYMAEAARLARRGSDARYGHEPRRTYAVGTSNGGYQVRRAVESYPQLFDGGVDWEGTFVDADLPNILVHLPPAILNFPDYVGARDPNSTAAKNIRAAGYPPDIVNGNTSLWTNYSNAFWEVTQCQWQKRLDPTYDTYGSGTGTYNYWARRSVSEVGANLASFATTGKIRRPLVTVAGTMDALLPIDLHARAYARRVGADLARRDRDEERDRDDDRPAYRLYEVQNGNHIETYKPPAPPGSPPTFAQLEYIEPHAQRAFDLLVDSVERGITLPASQCIPRGGAIAESPAQPGHCASLFVP